VTLRLKIEILKVFSLELDFSSEKKIKEEKDAKKSDDAPATKSK
jgi:hypothetical protein